MKSEGRYYCQVQDRHCCPKSNKRRQARSVPRHLRFLPTDHAECHVYAACYQADECGGSEELCQSTSQFPFAPEKEDKCCRST